MTPQMGTLTLYEVRYLPHSGERTRNEIRRTVYDNISPEQAAGILMARDLSFKPGGDRWAADRAGAHTLDARTGEEIETSGRLSRFPKRLRAAIADRVG